MMLGKPDRIHAEFVAKACLRLRFVDDCAIASGAAALRKEKVAEFHRRIPFALVAWSPRSRAKSVPREAMLWNYSNRLRTLLAELSMAASMSGPGRFC